MTETGTLERGDRFILVSGAPPYTVEMVNACRARCVAITPVTVTLAGRSFVAHRRHTISISPTSVVDLTPRAQRSPRQKERTR